MKKFRFAILGAGHIARQFCDAVSRIDGCEVCAVASKSLARAENFAKENGVESYYDDYEMLLEKEKPDCAYIAVTTNDHYRLSVLCVNHSVPVLCEKAMFQNSEEAKNLYTLASEKKIFIMEALWSRYLPAVQQAKRWVEQEKIGTPTVLQCNIGFVAPDDKENRYFNPKLGGGAAKDITVYAYEITTFILNQAIKNISVSATWSDTGVDVTDHVAICFEDTFADLLTSFVAQLEEQMVIYGRFGKIVLPHPHYASEAYLYGNDGELKEHFVDQETKNGFVYEIQDAIRCIQAEKLESDVVPWKDTLACAKLFDKINASCMDASGVENFFWLSRKRK